MVFRDSEFMSHRVAPLRPAITVSGVVISIMFLLISPQAVHASEVCSILDAVVAANEDSPPFASVIHLSAPNAECSVDSRHRLFDYSESQQRDSWACIWHETAIVDIDAALERAKDDYNRAFDEYIENSEYSDSSYSSAEAESDMKKRIRDNIKRERDSLYSRMNSDARNLVAALKQCFYEKKIRGTWGKFENYVRKMARSTVLHSGRWTVCQTAPATTSTSGNRTCIEISAYPYVSQSMGIEIYVDQSE